MEEHESVTNKRALRNFIKPIGHTDFVRDDAPLYEFCRHLGKPAEVDAFAGAAAVDDVFEQFAEANGRHSFRLAQFDGTYEVLRPGSSEVSSGQCPPEVPAQVYELKIKHFGGGSPHAQFRYRDLGSQLKPAANKSPWRGRVIPSRDVLYLVGVAENFADSAMMILWEHPDEQYLLVGIQLAKLSPGPGDADRRNYTIARRLAAIKLVKATNLEQLRKTALSWISEERMGVLIRIDPPSAPANVD